MDVFAQVASLGSFSAAAKALGMSQTMVANHVRHLEGRLGARLISRTTRAHALTEVGHAFLADAIDILARVDLAEATARERHGEPIGTLRVSATVAFGTHVVVPLVDGLLKAHPRIDVDLRLTDRLVDLAEDRIDAAFRFGDLPDSALIAKALRPRRRIACASPGYLAVVGAPIVPADLEGHECLLFREGPPRTRWRFAGVPDVEVHGRFVADNGAALLAAARAGMGIALLADFQAAEDIAARRLVEILADYATPSWPLSLVYQADRRTTATLRALIERVTAELA